MARAPYVAGIHLRQLFTEGTALGFLKPFNRARKLQQRIDAAHRYKNHSRRCHFELMEPRYLLAADPVIAGVTYLESDLGQDTTPDYFEVTFQGGSDTTQMTQFVINGDQDLSGGLSDGDMFFDVDSNGPGTGHWHDFSFHAGGSIGVTAGDIVGFTVSDDGLVLTVNVRNFEAGDRLAFTIDVDEVERLRTDKIASGVEFEGSYFNATFVDEHYTFNNLDVDLQVPIDGGFIQDQYEGVFFDEYDDLFAEGSRLANGTLLLSGDNALAQSDRTAGAIDAYELTPKPVTISGNVYHDENLNCERDANEHGIEGVTITLQKFNENTNVYETVATTTTNANGQYEFGVELGLMPGKYRLIEMQPDGYLDVAASAGDVEGVSEGQVQNDGDGNANIIGDIDIPLGGNVAENYDFKEVRPASLEGNVYHDRNDNGIMDPGEEGIANVLIRVTRVGAKAGTGDDPFANTEPIFVRTDANGHYEVTALPPGIYEVVEINNYPPGANPLVDFIDGKDTVGRVGNQTVGTGQNDRFNQVVLCADEHGVEYNFGELRPATISGYVSLATPEGDCLDPTDPNHTGIAGVEIQLFDIDGNLVASTTTDANGFYEFDDLAPGAYSIVEVQPDAYLDGDESIGRVNGQPVGLNPVNDRFVGVDLQSGDAGTMYNFCEHNPASLKGYVWHDRNDDGIKDAGEEGIAGTVVQLFDADGNLVAETVTDGDGRYCFEDLYAGEYKIVELQPQNYIDGKESLGAVGNQQRGIVEDDQFCVINLRGGEQGDNYNFGEIRLGSIEGRVHADVNGDCVFDASQGDRVLSGVTLHLLDSDGNLVAETVTDENGNYSFTGLRPGTYSVREFTPNGYLDGAETTGTVSGRSVGQAADDLLSGIVIGSGDAAVNYDFCEHIPAKLSGHVWHDQNNDGVMDDSEQRISNVTIELYDADGTLVSTTTTDADGYYCFENLMGGQYRVVEIQPDGYADGKDSLGRVDNLASGQKRNDEFVNVVLKGGQTGEHYDFGELRLASIEGFVHLDPNGDCVYQPQEGDRPIAGVTIQLLDDQGEIIAETQTDARGHYEFDKLLPGNYRLRQVQPDGVFTAGQVAGSGGGNDTRENVITNIQIESGQNLVQYNFCEQEAAEIHGRVWEDGPTFETADGVLPNNYRQLRDGVYTEGIDTPIGGVRMELWYYIDPDTGEIAPRPVRLSEVLGEFYTHMNTSDPNAAVWVETMADGQYWFRGLRAGNFIVVEAQPSGYTDANDIVGTTTGFSFNSDVEAAVAPRALLNTFSGAQIMDSIVNIRVNAGQVSLQNNFSEVRAVPESDRSTTIPDQNTRIPNPVPPAPPLNPGWGLAGAQSGNFTAIIGGGRAVPIDVAPAASPYTWHLSVVNAGHPRGGDLDAAAPTWLQASYLNQRDWDRFDMQAGQWTFTATARDGAINLRTEDAFFGMIDGIPLSGDFNGDGVDEISIYKDGYWLIDLNGNGRWDIDDLMARLGDQVDRPVVGDWDGDGKDDIGIFGPIWEGDPEAIEAEPGIPDSDNSPLTRPKNIPPEVTVAADGARVMRLSNFGDSHIDVIDHVFGYGDPQDIPVTGDWNGDSIRTIGIFRAGRWQLDLNGDGRFDYADAEFEFGGAGDIPLVGDFDGNGVDEVAVYRDGVWIFDSNGNRERDALDKVFEMGGRDDSPVVGDWDGDGIDEPAVYRSESVQARNAN